MGATPIGGVGASPMAAPSQSQPPPSPAVGGVGATPIGGVGATPMAAPSQSQPPPSPAVGGVGATPMAAPSPMVTVGMTPQRFGASTFTRISSPDTPRNPTRPPPNRPFKKNNPQLGTPPAETSHTDSHASPIVPNRDRRHARGNPGQEPTQRPRGRRTRTIQLRRGAGRGYTRGGHALRRLPGAELRAPSIAPSIVDQEDIAQGGTGDGAQVSYIWGTTVNVEDARSRLQTVHRALRSRGQGRGFVRLEASRMFRAR